MDLIMISLLAYTN